MVINYIPPGRKNQFPLDIKGPGRGQTKTDFLRSHVMGVGGVVDKMVKKPTKKQTREGIKKDLLDQLERNGVHGNHYLNLIDDYIALWEIKEKLIKDIKKRGVSIKWETYNREGEVVQSGYKKNDSIAELNKTNAQMLKILSELGLKAEKQERGEGDDDEM